MNKIFTLFVKKFTTAVVNKPGHSQGDNATENVQLPAADQQTTKGNNQEPSTDAKKRRERINDDMACCTTIKNTTTNNNTDTSIIDPAYTGSFSFLSAGVLTKVGFTTIKKIITNDFGMNKYHSSLVPVTIKSSVMNPGNFMKTLIRKCGVVAIALLIANLFFAQNSFGQAGPVRLKGSGGTSVTEINIAGVWYEIHTYATTGSNFTPPSGAPTVEYLVVAGGGGGGNTSDRTGGGGGAGGVLSGSSFGVTVQGYTVTVGAGGAANTAGNSSVFATFTAIGGGRGGQSGSLANSGGSGGGGYHNASDAGASGTSGQGNKGGNGFDSGNGTNGTFGGGGGGGQSVAGANGISGQAGNGGNGFTSLISGSSVVYAGGGGGGFQHLGSGSGNAGAGGTGGGGAGGSGTGSAHTNGTAGTANTGGGGGGAGGNSGGVGGAGGSGIVIIRYKAPTMAITTQPSVTVSSGLNFAQPVVIQILDGSGSPVSGIVVTAAIQSGTGGTLSNSTATTNASGNATFTNLHISAPAGNTYTLNFTVPGSGNAVVSNTISICNTITATATKNDISCFNTSTGVITVNVPVTGISPFMYSIDNGSHYYNANGSIYIPGATFDATGLTTKSFNNLPTGLYQVRIKDANGCESRSVQ